MQWLRFLVMIEIDLLVNLLDTFVLWAIPPKSCSWFWVALIWMLRFTGAIPILYGAEHQNGWLAFIANALFLWLAFFGGNGLGKKLWGKLRSAALTAVNQASFQNQTKEALS